MIAIPILQLLNVLNVAVADWLNVANEVHLGQTDIPINRDTTIAELEAVGNEADFAGYAAKTDLVFSAAVVDNDGNPKVIATETCMFAPTDGTKPQQIFHYWVTNAAGDLLFCERFPDDNPQFANDVPDVVAFTPAFGLPEYPSAAISG